VEQQLVDTYLHQALKELHVSPLSKQLIRRLATEESGCFTEAALKFLEKDGESGAHRYVSALLLGQPDIFDQISDPAKGSLQRAITLLRRMIAIDPSFDVKLARKLPDRSGANGAEAYEGMQAGRTLEILDRVSVGRRLVPVLGHLVRSPDPRLCAQAILFVGRRIQNPVWTERQLMHANDRVRANAIESLWGVTSASAIRLLESLVDDDSHRVAGNSLVGLHVVGVPGVLARLTEMAIHRNPKCRCTAAWAIGRVGDAIFVPLLNLLVTDRDPGVRSASLRALIQIRKSDDRTFEEIKEQALEISLTPELTNDELAENDIPIIPPLCGIQPQTGWIEFLHGTKLAV